ncbi:hypothetical protein ACHAWF_012550, partial [Thalassiosira exigua]
HPSSLPLHAVAAGCIAIDDAPSEATSSPFVASGPPLLFMFHTTAYDTMSPWQESTRSEQPAGLSTAETPDASEHSSMNEEPPYRNGSSWKVLGSNVVGGSKKSLASQNALSAPPPSDDVRIPAVEAEEVEAAVDRPTPTSSPPKKGKFPMPHRAPKPDYLDQSISCSAPTILINAPSNSSGASDTIRRPLRSAMSSRTVHESLHRGYGYRDKSRPKMNRSVSFAQVNIREYERVLGDNPSVTSGPPLSIGWRYGADVLSVDLDDYEEGKGAPRSSSEFLVPKAVRESLLRDLACVSRREMVGTIRAINKEKQHRRKTVVNLGMSKTEERIEGIRRKAKKILKPSTSYEALEARLWDNAHAVAVEKAKRLEDSIHRGESVSVRDLYAVGTPYDNILPSRRWSTEHLPNAPAGTTRETKDAAASEVGTDSLTDVWEESTHLQVSGRYVPKPPSQVAPPPEEGVAGVSAPAQDTTPEAQGAPAPGPRRSSCQSSSRSSGNIVASEASADEIFAKLVLDDAGS